MPIRGNPSWQACYGLQAPDVVAVDASRPALQVHRQLINPWQQLVETATKAGFTPTIISGFRDFERQAMIWNNKASGRRPILDDSGKPFAFSKLDAKQLLAAIMRFSAIPGASRHHWGCDIDIYDAAAVDSDYQVQLTPAEVADNGVFGAFHQWLDGYLLSEANPGFFRPYRVDSGGIAPERWHLSYAPLAHEFQQQLEPGQLLDLLEQQQLLLFDEIKEGLALLWESHIWVDWALYPAAYRPC